MKISAPSAIANLLLAGLALALIGCGEEAAGPSRSCAEIGDEATRAAGSDLPAFKVLSPNGGESYRVGDSVTVQLGANAEGRSAMVYLMVGGAEGPRRVRLPGTPAGRDLDPRVDCRVTFRIPESVTEGGVEVSLVSDAVKVRIAAYNSETLYFDESDGAFRIAR